MDWVGSLDWIDWRLVYYASEWAIRLTMLVVVPQRRSPTTASSWLMLIFFFPWPGLAIYTIVSNVSLPQQRRKRREKMLRKLADRVNRFEHYQSQLDPEVLEQLRQGVQLAQRLGRMPILDGNQIELLADYNGIIERIIADIDAARDHVHLLYYIFADDATGRRVADALKRAVGRGVRCRVLIDALGSRGARRRLVPDLRAAGVEVFNMLPVRLFKRLDVRNHRKIVVVDGRIGYVGSQNLVDAEFAEGITYEEMMARAAGPVVAALQSVFVDDWFLATNKMLPKTPLFPRMERQGDIVAQVLPSGPGYSTANNQLLFIALIHGARERIVITTPYFVPDEPLLQALHTAVLRGVDVHLVVSAKADQILVGLAQRSYYEQLLEYGVRIHAYKRHFLHAKHLTIDDEVTVIGSSNMDIRSFALNEEISMIIYNREITARMRAEQERYFQQSDALSLAKWRQRPWIVRSGQNVARLMSPLL
ncbi:MAG TPA: cardiolipin synthase [Lacipirellulaceae bacterium]|nr:cardiolipin synthase [Lacipirellulaceae bacterium]HMP04384.1 cardiolipin synthase [Gemmatales bacterium]